MTDLRKLAEAATPGPWHMLGEDYDPFQYQVFTVDHNRLVAHLWPPEKANAAFVAAASPDVILGLLDENERLRAALIGLANFRGLGPGGVQRMRQLARAALEPK